MSDLSDKLAALLDDKNDVNYDPRMEELRRSDLLIDTSHENLSVLEDPEIFHIAKIRGAQGAFNVPIWRIKKAYETPDMKDFHAPWIDFTRSLDAKNEQDRKLLETNVGNFVIINEMVKQLIMLRPALEGKRAILYADSIKPQVANNPVYQPQPQEDKEGFFSKALNFIFGKKQEDNRGYSGKR